MTYVFFIFNSGTGFANSLVPQNNDILSITDSPTNSQNGAFSQVSIIIDFLSCGITNFFFNLCSHLGSSQAVILLDKPHLMLEHLQHLVQDKKVY